MPIFNDIPRLFGFILLAVVVLGCNQIQQILSKEGVVYTVQINPNSIEQNAATERAIEVLKSRLDALSLRGSVIRVEGQPDQVTVKIYGKPDSGRVKKFLFTTNKLELKKIAETVFKTYPSKETAEDGAPADVNILPYVEDSSTSSKTSLKFVRTEKSAVLNGSDIRDARSNKNEGNPNYGIIFNLTPAGSAKFGEWTGKNIGSYLAIVLDDKVISAPVIRGQITDYGAIDGRFDKQSADDLALSLRSGYLEVGIKILNEVEFKE